ncbi:nitrous oxide-stimulated promoter family protein [Vagococcus vulneris]|uniref:Nitrous oxide-stimulated promoter family protein n=1 Tax=Vagococcus vulneris TaxID=1977869 RepID=A0A429ZXR8_9ENTE|nr:nitrous oxide-stimulated promoter family protein [Vagococcus vulneris]RST98606.1 hypothetical protein CBF37_07465 [Vagococcus vulneris]
MVKQKNNGPRITYERQTVQAMIAIYFKQFSDEEHQKEREEIERYAMKRLDFCQFGDDKPTCKTCPVHCYSKKYREKMKVIMIYSGPRMLIYHPLMSIKHFIKEHQRPIND